MRQTFTPGNYVKVKTSGAAPFKVLCSIDESRQAVHRQFCIEARRPRLYQQPPHGGRIAIVGYGPSLLETWEQIRRPIMTCSGAHNFFLDRGIVPDYHVEMDARLAKIDFLSRPQKGCQYLIASLCHPFIWPRLADHSVEYWHAVDSQHTVNWVSKFDPGSVVMTGGSLIGSTAIHLAGMLGYEHFDGYGLDCCALDGRWHAGPHHNTPTNPRRALVGSRMFDTTRTLIAGAWEFHDRTAPVADVTLHGRGMLAAVANDPGWMQQFQEAA